MPIEVITTIEDRSGTQGTTSVHVLDSSTMANLTTFAPLWATALNNFIFGKITSMIAKVFPSLIGLTSNTVQDSSDVEHVGKFVFRTQTNNRVEVNIPCLDEVAVNADNTDNLDLAAAEVAAFVAAMETGIAVTGGTISPCDIGEVSIGSLSFAREAFRNSGKRR